MKKETLQKRIEKNLYTKKGTLASKYGVVMFLLENPNYVSRPVRWHNAGRGRYQLEDHSYNIEHALTLLGVSYETGNDAPRGGKEGYYIRLTPKGKRQVKEYAAAK